MYGIPLYPTGKVKDTKMPSKKKGQFLPGEMKLAVEDVLKHKKSIRKAAKENNVD